MNSKKTIIYDTEYSYYLTLWWSILYGSNATPEKVIPAVTLTTANSIHGNITLKDKYTLLFHKN